jgi:D-alanyl-D-alanine carboxypeptidase (penicillin-binding protein 5/6)
MMQPRQRWAGLVFVLAGCSLLATSAAVDEQTPHSVASILIDAKTGTVLRESNADQRLPIASTTKIMTAILIVEHGNLNDIVTVSKHAAATEDSPLALLPGETVPLRDLLSAVLMRSANDASVAAAEHVAGSESEFVEMMNKRAADLGAINTHFVNPHGLDAPNHYSTARDLAIIARYALRHDVINQVLVSPPVIIDRSLSQDNALIPNRNKFLQQFDGADGVKTGYTKEAGHCFVGSATRHGWRLISVVLNSTDCMAETAAALSWGFRSFRLVTLGRRDEIVGEAKIEGGAPRSCGAVLGRDLCVVVPRDSSERVKTQLSYAAPKPPIRAGERIGKITATLAGHPIASVPLLSDRRIEKGLFYLPSLKLVALVLLALGTVLAARYVSTTAKTDGRTRRRLKKNVRRAYRPWEGDG